MQKTLVILSFLFLLPFCLFSQSLESYNKTIDSLSTIKSSISERIRTLEVKRDQLVAQERLSADGGSLEGLTEIVSYDDAKPIKVRLEPTPFK